MDAELKQRIETLVKDLGEHCESVRIFVTYPGDDAGQTGSFTFAAGNYYASRGQVDEWLVMERQRERQQVIKSEKEDSE